MNILEVRELKKTYTQGVSSIPVLAGVELNIARGETVAIVGQSGSGKSTLLSLLAGLDRPDSGAVTLEGSDLTKLSETALAKLRGEKLGIVFQQFHLMSHLTALENVRLPLEIARVPLKEATSRAREALAKVGLSHRESHLPTTLSGGEKQRVAIARAFVLEPRLLLADEPSGNLDPATGEHVMGMLFDLVRANQMTMILVTHNHDLARRCDRALTLRDGALVEV